MSANTFSGPDRTPLASARKVSAAALNLLVAFLAGLRSQTGRAWAAAPRVARLRQALLPPGELAAAPAGLARALRHGAQVTLRSAKSLRVRPALAAVAAAAVLVVGYLVYCLATLPLAGGLIVEATPSALVVEAADGQVFATRGVFKGDKLAAGDVPPDLARAVVAIEDRRFYQHWGVDGRGILRAALHNVAAGGAREGASTITQQLVRMTYLSPERTLRRKVQEAMLALWLERQLSKEEILVRYLNTAYFGAGVYGVDAAAKRYFGKAAKDLSLSEAAMLAGLVRAPSALAPHRNLERARRRADLVLDAMVETNGLSRAQADAAHREPTALRVPPETPAGSNYFVDMLNAEVRSLLGPASGDWRVRSTLDMRLQTLAETVVARRLAADGKSKNVGQAALVAMAPDGAILAMVGGRDYNESQFNRATQAKRQPGSLFKLFVYLAALQKGYTPHTVVIDRPVQIGNWEPGNYRGRYRGAVPLRAAFAHSLNTVAVQLADEVGINNVIAVAKGLGIQSDLPAVPSLALGSAEVTLLEMTRAFAAIAANVESAETYSVRSIARGDQAMHARAAAPRPAPADPASRAAIIDLLASVVREGTGKAARLAGPAAGKTGTTQDYRDAWFIGFAPEIVVGVWVGNDDNAPMDGVTGGSLPATIWREFVTQAAAGKPLPATAPLRRRAPVMGVPLAAPEQAPPATAPPAAGTIAGTPVVLDTGTLQVQGQIVRLHGIEGFTGRIARSLGRFLRRREVICEPASGQEYRCRLGDQDLSELILSHGAGRASADAPAELRAAEERAREMRSGYRRRY